MATFMIRFFICNIYIIGIFWIFLIAKWLFRNHLSSRMQYNLWYLFLGVLFLPFLSFHVNNTPQGFMWIDNIQSAVTSSMNPSIIETFESTTVADTQWLNDFTLSVSSDNSSKIGLFLFIIWMLGIFIMTVFSLLSVLKLYKLKNSALPVQNQLVLKLYLNCLEELQIKHKIPLYSTAFLSSPVLIGLAPPCIYLPIHLISEYDELDMRYMLLHELQHYKHYDNIGNYLMNGIRIIYWFNPFIWYALKLMRNEREIACDTSVLNMLEEENYINYGSTLINLAEKLSKETLPFAIGLHGNMSQMKSRITHIALYKKPTRRQKAAGIICFILTATLLWGLAPFLTTYANDDSYYQWNTSDEKINIVDCSTYFGEYEGSFVLYDTQNDDWNIYNLENATLRVSPDSTYKIYSGLFGLEENIITADNSSFSWDGELYLFEEWNIDHNLMTAMSSSVNWYFQTIDEELGTSILQDYLQKIEYGNENISGELSSYWLESSLKISSIEQVELLTKLQDNSYGFSPENISAITDAIYLSTSEDGALYGKTGTGQVDSYDINGWFIGYIESTDNTYIFATNIRSDENATGSTTAEITFDILSDMHIWNY